MNKKLNTCLIGYGYWGKNLLRTIVENQSSAEIFIYDKNPDQSNKACKLYPQITKVKSLKEICNNNKINAVIIATPTSTHFKIAKACLLSGKHVLVEKPLSTGVREAEELFKLSKANSRILMVDHIFLYNPVIKMLKKYLDISYIGSLSYIDTTRVNLGIYQNDTNVLWDLACHDIAIMTFLLKEKPNGVRAIGKLNKVYGVEDTAYLFLYYPSGLLVQINSSWASPVKMRKMIIGGEKKMIIYDDIEPTNKIVIYDYEQQVKDVNKTKLADYRLGNITIPKYEMQEPLKNVLNEFYNSINTGKLPLADGKNAIEVIEILEKAEMSLRSNGEIVKIN